MTERQRGWAKGCATIRLSRSRGFTPLVLALAAAECCPLCARSTAELRTSWRPGSYSRRTTAAADANHQRCPASSRVPPVFRRRAVKSDWEFTRANVGSTGEPPPLLTVLPILPE